MTWPHTSTLGSKMLSAHAARDVFFEKEKKERPSPNNR